MNEKIGKFEISELLELSKKTPQSALVLAHGEGLLEGIERIKQRLALKDLEIMRLREALEELKNTLPVRGWARFIATNALSTPTTYDDLMAWHDAQLGEPVAWMNKEHWFPVTDDPEWDADNWIPLYARKDK